MLPGACTPLFHWAIHCWEGLRVTPTTHVFLSKGANHEQLSDDSVLTLVVSGFHCYWNIKTAHVCLPLCASGWHHVCLSWGFTKIRVLKRKEKKTGSWKSGFLWSQAVDRPAVWAWWRMCADPQRAHRGRETPRDLRPLILANRDLRRLNDPRDQARRWTGARGK